MACFKLAPALACGNTVVLKPAENTPLTALRLGELLLEAGLPEGVLNVVPGFGADAGEALVKSKLVDKIAFTGSTVVGKSILMNAGIKRITLEMGGKNPMIIMNDADIPTALFYAQLGGFVNSG